MKEYILVSSKKKKVEIFKKFKNDDWLQHTYFEKDEKVKIGDCELLFEDKCLCKISLYYSDFGEVKRL